MRQEEKIICNKCGKEILIEKSIYHQDVLTIEKRWGYFSEKDNEVHTFDICEACYDEWTSTFLVPVEVE